MRTARSRSFNLLSCLVLTGGMLGGCDGDSEPPPNNVDPETNESPTPTPDLAGEYRTKAFAIAGSTEGFDLDDDADIDNNLPAVLDTLNSELYNAIYNACALIEPNAPQQCADQVWGVLTTNGLVLDVNALNQAIALGISEGDLNYLEYLSGTPSDATLAWYEGYLTAANEYVTDYTLGSQSGVVEIESGQSLVGPGTFTYELNEGMYLSVVQTFSEFVYVPNVEGETAGSLDAGLLGGAVVQSEIEQFLRDLIPGVLDDEEEQIIAEVISALNALQLFDLTVLGEPAFSVAFTFAATPVQISNVP